MYNNHQESAARKHTTSAIGAPISFFTGPFAQKTIRAHIHEVQKADLGRKCADPPTSAASPTTTATTNTTTDDNQDNVRSVRKDRRPLDPPPVVSLKIFQVFHPGTDHEYEREIPAEDIEIGGLICQVDLFRVTIPQGVGEPVNTIEQRPFAYPQYYPDTPPPPPSTAGPSTSPPTTTTTTATGATYTYPDIPGGPPTSFDSSFVQQQSILYPYNRRSSTRTQNQTPRPPPSLRIPPPSIDVDSLPPPTESDKLTRCLFGEYYSHAASILDLQGKAVIYFVFSDLSVKLEGLFRPRYRFFDLFSRTEFSDDVPILAECFGGAFAVYSTKEFPGLKASTELTKHLNRWGIRVNIRETERKRRAPGSVGGGGGPTSASASGSGPGTGDREEREERERDKEREPPVRKRRGSKGSRGMSGSVSEDHEGVGGGHSISTQVTQISETTANEMNVEDSFAPNVSAIGHAIGNTNTNANASSSSINVSGLGQDAQTQHTQQNQMVIDAPRRFLHSLPHTAHHPHVLPLSPLSPLTLPTSTHTSSIPHTTLSPHNVHPAHALPPLPPHLTSTTVHPTSNPTSISPTLSIGRERGLLVSGQPQQQQRDMRDLRDGRERDRERERERERGVDRGGMRESREMRDGREGRSEHVLQERGQELRGQDQGRDERDLQRDQREQSRGRGFEYEYEYEREYDEYEDRERGMVMRQVEREREQREREFDLGLRDGGLRGTGTGREQQQRERETRERQPQPQSQRDGSGGEMFGAMSVGGGIPAGAGVPTGGAGGAMSVGGVGRGRRRRD